MLSFALLYLLLKKNPPVARWDLTGCIYHSPILRDFPILQKFQRFTLVICSTEAPGK
jgi:hypothetical protein